MEKEDMNYNKDKMKYLITVFLVWLAITLGLTILVSTLIIFFYEIILNYEGTPYKKVFRYSFFAFGSLIAIILSKNK